MLQHCVVYLDVLLQTNDVQLGQIVQNIHLVITFCSTQKNITSHNQVICLIW